MAEYTKEVLEGENYSVKLVDSAFKTRSELNRAIPDLIILDLKLPDIDGTRLCQEIRQSDKVKATPILILTTKKTISDKVVGFRMGADDYLTKPFQPQELLVRIEALLRRAGGFQAEKKVYQVDRLILDADKHECFIDKKRLDLWPKEFALLQTFLENKGRMLNREFLSQRVWGFDYAGSTRAVDMAIMRLKKKIKPYDKYIQPIRAYGYRFTEDP